MGPTAALPATVFLGIVVGVLGNFQCLFIFQGSSPYISYFLGFAFYLYSFSFSNVLRVLFCFLVLFVVLQIYLSSFLGRESGDELQIMLATQLIKARARQDRRVSLCDQQSINKDPKLEKGKGKNGSTAQSYIQFSGHVTAICGNVRQCASAVTLNIL